MPVSGITSLVSAYVQKITGSSTSSSSSAPTVASAAQEASETVATTTKEAKHGDVAAKLKLKQVQAKQQQAQAAQPPTLEPGKGELVDHHA